MAQSNPNTPDDQPGPAVGPLLAINLNDCNGAEHLPFRDLILSPPYSVRIGRGSQTDPKLQPRGNNAWFASRVMSRDHAIIRADPVTRLITLEDTGSLHGTFVEGKRLQLSTPEGLLQNDTITFGADIVRGELTYEALVLRFHYQWSDEPRPSHSTLDPFRNTFTADYSEDDTRSDHGGDFAADSVSHTELGVGYKSRTFSVPDSDESELDSDLEDDPEREVESSPSSLTGPDETIKIQATTVKNDAVHAEPEAVAILQHPEIRTLPSNEQDSADENANHDTESADDFDLDHDPSVHEVCSISSDSEDEAETSEDELSDKSSVADKDDPEIQAPHVSARDTQCEYASNTGPFGTNLPNPCFPRYTSYAALPAKSSFPASNLASQGLHSAFTRDFGWPGPDPFALDYQPVPFYNNALPPIQSMPANSCARFDSQSNVYPQPVPPAPVMYGTYATYAEDLQGTRAKDLPESDVAQPAKVSIQDIVEPVVISQSETTTSLKRKAKESIDGSEDTAPVTVAAHETANTTSVSQDENLGSTKEAVTEEPSATTLDEMTIKSAEILHEQVKIAPVDPSSEPDGERPSKKAKIVDTRAESRSSSNTILKYTATAFAGMAVGAVSTVFGLAALPADYFN